MIRVLLLGGGGMLAQDLRGQAPSGVELVALSHADLDVTDDRRLEEAIRQVSPEIVLNASAYTAVDKAESERERAQLVNGTAVGRLAVHSARRGALLVHFSTDYVFDGRSSMDYTETARPNPVNVYGETKLAGEQAIQAVGAPHIIIRTSWLYGATGRSFPRTMWDRAMEGKATRVVNDQVGSPTYTSDLATAGWALALSPGEGGLYHVTNRGSTTWFEVATRIFNKLDRGAFLTPCTTAEYPAQALRPARSVLATTRSDLPFSQLRRWDDALDEFLGRLANTA